MFAVFPEYSKSTFVKVVALSLENLLFGLVLIAFWFAVPIL